MRCLAVVVLAACGVRAPSPIDVGALLARRGPVEAHRDLEIRILADPKDVQARLALAELDERIDRRGEAIDELLAVERLGGPIGARWHDADRARLARLLVERAQLRLARDAPTALGDLEHARQLGGPVAPHDVIGARIARALAQLRHVDAKERAKGRATLGELAADTPDWLGARAHAPAEARGRFGEWAWSIGARREAYEQLAAWHAATSRPRDPQLEAAYLRALAWWAPAEVEPPDETTDALRCWFVKAGCAPPSDERAGEPAAAGGDARAAAAARRAGAPVLAEVAHAFARDPAIADRHARDFVAQQLDAAAAHAALGALFDALGDPARAREHWQAAVDASDEWRFERGLAEAAARAGDGPGALVFATAAAAASGDPAVVWLGVARALEERELYVDALTAAHSAIDLGDVETLPGALEVAAAASRALGRAAQADAFAAQRLKLPLPPADIAEALAALRALPGSGSFDRAWAVTRAHRREVELRVALLAALPPDDSRRAPLVDELVGLAGDPDPARALAAARALH